MEIHAVQVVLCGRPTAKNLSDEIDAWAADQKDELIRSEAIRRLVELGLKAKAK